MPAAIGVAIAMMFLVIESCVRSFIEIRSSPPERLPRIRARWRERDARCRCDARRSAGPRRVRYARGVSSRLRPIASTLSARRRLRDLGVAVAGLCLVGIAYAAMPWRGYPGVEHDGNSDLPTDYMVPAEWTFARLMYPEYNPYRSFRYGGRGSDWTQGYTSWTIDYPQGDR